MTNEEQARDGALYCLTPDPRGAGLNPVASAPLTFDQEQETIMQIARQGDVLIYRVDALPSGLKEAARDEL